MAVEFERGYLILAYESEPNTYTRCARALAKSLRYHMPNCKICLVTNASETDSVFDIVKPFPFPDQSPNTTWKLANDWQAYHATPFRETIKLEADMIINNDIDHWWSWFEHRDVVISKGMRNYLNNESNTRVYRRAFDDNELPDVYNAITYWRLSKTAVEFWQLVRTLFDSWSTVKTALKYCDTVDANTDMVYAIAAKMMGEERVTLPGNWPNMIHMKSAVNHIKNPNNTWDKELVWELVDGYVRVNTVAQTWPWHYHHKEFAKELEEYYGQLLASRS